MIDHQTAPYPLILATFVLVTIVCLIFFVRSVQRSGSNRSRIRLVIVWSLICLALQVVMLGLPWHWSVLSLIGKLVAEFVGTIVVFVASAWAVWFANKREIKAPLPALYGVLAGLLGIAPSMIVGLFLACALTRDCV